MKLRLVTGEEAIRFLGLDRSNLRRPDEALRWLRRTGQLRHVRIGHRIFYLLEWLEHIFESTSVQRAAMVSTRASS